MLNLFTILFKILEQQNELWLLSKSIIFDTIKSKNILKFMKFYEKNKIFNNTLTDTLARTLSIARLFIIWQVKE